MKSKIQNVDTSKFTIGFCVLVSGLLSHSYVSANPDIPYGGVVTVNETSIAHGYKTTYPKNTTIPDNSPIVSDTMYQEVEEWLRIALDDCSGILGAAYFADVGRKALLDDKISIEEYKEVKSVFAYFEKNKAESGYKDNADEECYNRTAGK